MEYSKIIAITSLPGLYELISSKSDGGIVRSLTDKTTKFVSSRVHQFSHLESIEVYTVRHNVNLVEILKAMEESKQQLPDEKNADAVKKYFEKVYGDLDFDRVYNSDLKKMIKWYSVLKDNNIELKLSEAAEPEPEPVEIEEKKPAATVKPEPAPKKKAEAPVVAEIKKAAEKPKAAAKPKEEPKKEIKKPAEKPKAAAKTKAAPKKAAEKPKATAKPKKK